jgi:GPH family glycoside/pentoside/hexuronide:cation symporter
MSISSTDEKQAQSIGAVKMFLARFKSKVPPKDQVPFLQKIAYGLGGPIEGTAVWVPQSNLTPVFNIGLGMNPALLGLILMIWRGWDCFADPIVGNISDNARTPWGRRKPFIVLGAILTGVTLPLMWWSPQGLNQNQLFYWLLVSGLLFYSFFPIWAMPYYSLSMEMSPDYDERTNITSYRCYAQQFFGLFAAWILAFAASPIFGDVHDNKPNLVNGMRYISLALAFITIFFGVLPGLFVKERYYEKDASKQAKEPLLRGIKQTLSTRPFLWLLIIVICGNFGFGLVGILGFYVNAYYVCDGNLALATEIQGVKSTLLFLPNLLTIPLCTWLTAKYGKKFLLYVTAASGLLGNISIYFFYTPSHPWLQILPALLLAPMGQGPWLILPAMQADVADYDELFTGQRREGSFSAIFSWTLKAQGTIVNGLSGLVLVWTGFAIEKGPHQPLYVLDNLKSYYIWIPVISLILYIFAISRYELTRGRMNEIRKELELRRGEI